MKKVLISLLILLILPGCSWQKSATPLFPARSDVMTVTYYHCTGVQTWELCQEEIQAVYDWAAGMQVRKTSFPAGHTPYDAEGGEVCVFRSGSETISFVAMEYLERDGVWYVIKAPTSLPVPLAG